MDREIKREALRQYFKYFRLWFIAVGVVAVVLLGTLAYKIVLRNLPRKNTAAPAERVYDYADVLTDKEEEDLRDAIAQAERQSHVDIIIMTINEPMGLSDPDWKRNMMNYADDFYDNGKFGWNKAHGDGALLLDNWYEDAEGSQKGTWLSSSGKMEDTIGKWEEEKVLDDMYEYIDSNPYKAYLAAVIRLRDFGKYGATSRGYGESDFLFMGLLGAVIISAMVALFYAMSHFAQIKTQDITAANTYVPGGVPIVRARTDEFLRKSVTSHRIESSSSGGGGGSSHRGGGSYGHHTSSGGHSHGGGGRRR